MNKLIRVLLALGALILSLIVVDLIAYQFSADKRGGYVPAVRFWRHLAKMGLSSAQLNLAVRYDRGKGVPHDLDEAFKWYQKAAEHGSAKAQNKLGEMYELGLDANGHGVPKNIDESFKWYKKSAEQGYPLGQLNLSWMYNSGLGAPQDFNAVIHWTRKAANQGFADAQNILGWRYYVGKRVPQNLDEATFWFRKAAQQGHPISKYFMGVIENDTGVIKQTQTNAENGNPEAQYLIGFRYYTGKYVPQDYEKAAYWFRKAAEQDQPISRYFLGLMHEEGKGVPKDSNEAMKWYQAGAVVGSRDAQLKLGMK